MPILSNFNRTNFFYIVFIGICLFLTSCGSSKSVVYNPIEVEDLSRKLGFSITNTDVNMPLYAESSLWLGVRYKYAGLDRRGIDCSGLVHRIFQNVYSRDVSRSTNDLVKATKKVSKGKLTTGDLVFFATSSRNKKQISHVGIYLKDGYFVHASTSRGVIVSHLKEDYYKRTWKKGGRLK